MWAAPGYAYGMMIDELCIRCSRPESSLRVISASRKCSTAVLCARCVLLRSRDMSNHSLLLNGSLIASKYWSDYKMSVVVEGAAL